MRFNKIYIEITNICNLNCSFCSKDNREKREISLQEFDIILNKIKNYTKNIYLHVKGEPLLHSKFEEILKLTNKYNFNVRLTTNGTLLKKQINNLQKFDNIRQINISLHSENKLPNYFKNIFESIDILSLKIPTVYRIWLLDNYKLDKLSTIIVDKIINYYHLNNNFKSKIINEKNIKIKNNIYLDKDNKFIWPTHSNSLYKNITNGTCLGTRNQIAILVNGDVVPCCLDSSARLKLGNIFTDNLEDILHSKLFLTINQGFKNNQLLFNICQNCKFRELKIKNNSNIL